MSEAGKFIRLSRIFQNGRAVIVPMDDGLIDGPEEGLRRQQQKLKEIIDGGADAVLGFRGLFKNSYSAFGRVAGIMNLTASTVRSTHTKKVLIGQVEDALYMGLEAVAVHVNISSEYESGMLEILGTIAHQCEIAGMPLMALMYPRSEIAGRDNNYLELKTQNPQAYAELVRHAARVGVELGADIIKTQYTGSSETFTTVVEACGSVPVVIAGGPRSTKDEALRNAYGAIQAGAAGICFGRNTFNRSNTTDFVTQLRRIVHDGSKPGFLD